jgi:hypothetical protein
VGAALPASDSIFGGMLFGLRSGRKPISAQKRIAIALEMANVVNEKEVKMGRFAQIPLCQ